MTGDWYEEQVEHCFDDVEKAADAEAQAVLDEDRALRALEQQSTTNEEQTRASR